MDYVVVTVANNGMVHVYGPYTRGKASSQARIVMREADGVVAFARKVIDIDAMNGDHTSKNPDTEVRMVSP